MDNELSVYYLYIKEMEVYGAKTIYKRKIC